MGQGPEITELVNRSLAEGGIARDAVVPLIYRELRKIAASLILEPGQTLTATVLVHEAFEKLFSADGGRVADRKHFYALAAKAMRQIQIDDYRARHAEKRFGGQVRVQIEDALSVASGDASPEDRVDFLALDAALTALSKSHERAAQLVELRYFAGMSLPEAAEAMDVSLATAKREWIFAKAWLLRKMKPLQGTA